MRRFLFAIAALLLMFSVVVGAPAGAASGDIGYRDFQFGSSCNSTPTGEKPESKLWWNDGLWWGSLCATDNTYHIFRLDLSSQTWIDTGTPIDDRPSSKADTLWDGQRLYVASHIFSSSGSATSSPSQWGRLYSYTYTPATKTYTPVDLDASSSNVWVAVTRGKSETLVLEKAVNGQLWVTYVQSGSVLVNHSNATASDWGLPFALPVAGASNLDSDDIASMIAFDKTVTNHKIGILWSNQTDKKMYFATHTDGASDSSWNSFGVYLPTAQSPSAADDHINIKLQSDGVGVYAVTKTSNSTSTQPLVVLLACTGSCASAGNWSITTVYNRSDNHTRAILLLDTTNRKINIFSTTPETGGNIYRKVSDMDNIAFTSGHGDLFIKNALDLKLNNPTSTKQNVNSTTGLVILASDQDTRRYLHNYDSLGGATISTATPTTTASPTATRTATPTNVPGSTSTPTSTPTSTSVPGSTATPTRTATPTTAPTPSGGTRKDITFESGALVNATTGVDSTSGSVTIESGQPLKGSYSARIANVGSAYLQKSFSAAADTYASIVLRIDARPTSDTRIVLLSNSGTSVGNLVLRSTGALRLRSDSTSIGADSAPLNVGTTYRIGLHQRQGSGSNAVLEAYVAVDGAAFGTPFAATTSGTWTTAADRLRFGATTSTVTAVTFDDIKIDSAGMP
jgi:hypothetical protein